MVKKIGDVLIGLIFLSFTIGAFSILIGNMDSSTGVSSGVAGTYTSDINDNISGIKSGLVTEFDANIDTIAEYEVNPDTQVEDRNSEASGILNLLSKNILVNFLTKVSDTFAIPYIVSSFIIMLCGATIGILFIRFFWGQDKI